MHLSYLTLLSGLFLSLISEYFSIVGLMAIFSTMPLTVAVMGIALGVGKIVATVWLKQHWNISPLPIKIYLISAIIVLMFITSLGCFGLLSKAHSDQSLVSGDVQSKLAIYDEKIKTAKENIETDRRQLKQMDEAVEQVMARSTTEEGAARSVAVRKAQARDRSALAKNIETNQKLVAALNNEAAPIRAEIRKVEAEVGPLKYIAAFIYGETDKTILEKSVTWVIIIIVLVFDPLAVVLLLAGQYSFQNFRERTAQLKEVPEPPKETMEGNSPEKESDVVSTATVTDPFPIVFDPATEDFDISKHPYLFKVPENRHPPGIEPVGPQVYKPEEVVDTRIPTEEIVHLERIEELVRTIEENVEKLSHTNEDKVEQHIINNEIDEKDYRNLSQEKLEIEINRYAGMLRNKQIKPEDIPEILLPAVKSRV